MRRFASMLCCTVACLFALQDNAFDCAPCACQVLSINPNAKWRIEDVCTPYSDGSAGYLEGRDSGYLAVMMYTCDHGVHLTVKMDADTKICWGSINNPVPSS